MGASFFLDMDVTFKLQPVKTITAFSGYPTISKISSSIIYLRSVLDIFMLAGMI